MDERALANKQAQVCKRAQDELTASIRKDDKGNMYYLGVSDATKAALKDVGVEPDEYIKRIATVAVPDAATVSCTVGVSTTVYAGVSDEPTE